LQTTLSPILTAAVANAPPPATPALPLTIVMAETTSATRSGVTVSGNLGPKFTLDDLSRLPYISGTPGTMFDDGTFEFRNVVPGRHTVVALGNSRGTSPAALAAVVVVGDRDLDGFSLEQIPFLPASPRTPKPPEPAGDLPPGAIRFPRIHGVLVNQDTKQPIPEGTVFLWSGGVSQSYDVDTDGKFDIPMILPGSYRLDVRIFGHSDLHQQIEILDKDITLNLSSKKLY
jgi:hypothetical protein